MDFLTLRKISSGYFTLLGSTWESSSSGYLHSIELVRYGYIYLIDSSFYNDVYRGDSNLAKAQLNINSKALVAHKDRVV